MPAKLTVGFVGAGWMGKAHATAFANAVTLFGSRIPEVKIAIVADVNIESARLLAEATGCPRWTTDWRDVVATPDIQIVDITTPNDTHFEIARAAIAAGKHIYCEKPLTIQAKESAILVKEADQAGIITLVGFNYLMNPIQSLARDIIKSGEIGDVVSFRGIRDGDTQVSPLAPFSWRHDRKIAGTGALGDTGVHALSMAQLLVGDVDEVFGMMKTFIPERPVSMSGSGYSSKADLTRMRKVENDDSTMSMLSFKNGASGSMSCSRVATGRRSWLSYEIHGTKGALFFTQQLMNELHLFKSNAVNPGHGYKIIHAGPQHGHYPAFYERPGMQLGYNDLKVIEAFEFLFAVQKKRRTLVDFGFAHKVTEIAEAIELSALQNRWVSVGETST
jgi:predicted dehydrogenase